MSESKTEGASEQASSRPLDRFGDIVDRRQRDALAAVIRRFLNEEITAFAFDEQLIGFHDSSDNVVRFVAGALWYHYDDCTDHLAALSKAEWDYFQRLLLLLESDYDIETVGVRRWSPTQLLALMALMGFGWVAISLGWGTHLLAVAMPFGVVSIAISWFRRHATAATGPYDPLVFPFAGFADLRAAYEKVAFKKVRYPRHLASRRMRSPLLTKTIELKGYVVWLMLSPIVLLFQTLPIRETQTRAVPFGCGPPQLGERNRCESE